MYIDEDGDVAHEFYRQQGRGQPPQRVTTGLTPVGETMLDHPTLHPALPILLCTSNDLDR